MSKTIHTQVKFLLRKHMQELIQIRRLGLCRLNGFKGFGFDDYMQQSLERFLSGSLCISTFEVFIHDGHLKAYILILPGGDGYPRLELDYDLESQLAEDWISDALSKILKSGNFICRLNRSYQKLLDVFFDHHHGIKYLSLGGDTDMALSHLSQVSYSKSEDKITDDIWSFSPLNDLNDINAVIDLQCEVYNKHPEYCWYFDSDRDRKIIARRLEMALPYQTYYKVLINGKIEGFFGYHIIGQAFLFGPEATITICLRESLQGKGLARVLYKRIFEDMLARNIYQFQSQTANEAVLCLAKKFKRPTRYMHIFPSIDCPDSSRFSRYIAHD